MPLVIVGREDREGSGLWRGIWDNAGGTSAVREVYYDSPIFKKFSNNLKQKPSQLSFVRDP
jgi:hypothetical protein